MIDKYCVYIYSLHYVQREYIYHTTNRREVGIRTQLPPVEIVVCRSACTSASVLRHRTNLLRCTHRLRSLDKGGGVVTFHQAPPMVKLQSTNSSSRRPSLTMPSIMWSMMRSMTLAWSLQFPYPLASCRNALSSLCISYGMWCRR